LMYRPLEEAISFALIVGGEEEQTAHKSSFRSVASKLHPAASNYENRSAEQQHSRHWLRKRTTDKRGEREGYGGCSCIGDEILNSRNTLVPRLNAVCLVGAFVTIH